MEQRPAEPPASPAAVVPVVDVHNDLLLELDWRREEPEPFRRTWLPNLRQGGVALQVCPLYTAQPEWLPELALRHALQQATAFHRALDEDPEHVFQVRWREDVADVGASSRIGLMLSMEGVEPLGYDPHLFDVFWELGVRMVSLTWNRRNPFADGLAEESDGGLSRLGRILVDRMAARDVVVDLAHASERTFDQVIDRRGSAHVIVSHAACRAVHDTNRNLSDRQLRSLAEHGGVLGLMLLPLVIDPDDRSVERVLAHVDHAVEKMGIEHVGLGGDFIAQVAEALGWVPTADSLSPHSLSFSSVIEGLRGPEGYQQLLLALRDRGYADRELELIAHGNFLRVLANALPARG